MGDIRSLEHCCETHTVIGLTTLTQADMIKAPVVWTCSFVISLLVGSCHAQKLNIHWGPQSMMYLKGKFGRRFVSEDENSLLKQALHGWYAVLKDKQRQLSKASHMLNSEEKVLIHYLQDR
ncbi:spexin prohormone 2 isoform X4 [Solea solea]|uniref:spexin prohormone 2 isoform X4 n=1 Tax=Solea solea TaxID=90069 RepID=UPI00272BE149|nr:spexin prohormone 2 isoform X4 [Solea solea]